MLNSSYSHSALHGNHHAQHLDKSHELPSTGNTISSPYQKPSYKASLRNNSSSKSTHDPEMFVSPGPSNIYKRYKPSEVEFSGKRGDYSESSVGQQYQQQQREGGYSGHKKHTGGVMRNQRSGNKREEENEKLNKLINDYKRENEKCTVKIQELKDKLHNAKYNPLL